MRYYANYGPKGPLWHCDVPGALRVYEVSGGGVPIGVALGIGPDRNGLALFGLTIGSRRIPGEWRLISREFTLGQQPVLDRPRYYSDFGGDGPLGHRDAPGAMGVQESPEGDARPVGVAYGLGPDDEGLARFRLSVRGRDIPGVWHLVGREFVRVK